MSIFDNPGYLKSLQDLLNPKRDEDSSSDSEDENINSVEKKPLLGFVNKTETKEVKNNGKLAKETAESWLEKQQQEDELLLETRKTPNYKMSYKQSVGTEDVFLQMGNRSASSISCEDMVITIELPEEIVPVEQMNLDISENDIDLQTPVYRLKVPLVHPIDPDLGTAKYDSETKILILTLKMKREFDFVNF
uniref:PIH1D1/2/3 CS-like domain-containing protein n=1 Tax=Megaselia scalaris TaxID=36166 RepID=T1GPS5_MEGSC